MYYRDYLGKIWRNSKIHDCQPILENYRHWLLSQQRGNPDRKQATVPVKIYSNVYVRLGNFNPPTFCLVYSIVARAWIHKCPSGRPRHVYNSIWANWNKEPTLIKTTLSLSTCHATAKRANSNLGENYISDIILLHVFESFERNYSRE